jgi:2-iminobutanoate/2-iminopropanoate deaminase/2-aminomuconate deaminase
MTDLVDRRTLLRALGALPSVLPLWVSAAGHPSTYARGALSEAVGQTRPGAGLAPSFTRVPLAGGIIPHAGATSMELYHRHPHDPREEVVQPDDIRLQTRLTLRNHKEILDWLGLGWRNVVKLTRYQTRMEESPAIEAVLRSYFGDLPPQTIHQVNGLSSPQARVEIEMWIDARGTRQAKGLRPVVPRPEVTERQAFSLAIEIGPDMDLVFFSGVTAYPPETDPWNPASFTVPADAAERGRVATEHLGQLLKAAGTTWQGIIFNVNWNAPAGGAINVNAQYGESWRPCSTTVRVNDTGIPGATVLYQITAAAPHRPIAPKTGAVPGIEPILLRPGVALKELPQAPGIRVTRDVDLVYFPGITAYPREVDPWNPGSYRLPDDLAAQEKMVANNIDQLLKAAGLTWRYIIVMNRTGEVRGARWMEDRFGDWRPCRTTRAVPTGIPGARLMVEITAVAPGRGRSL